MGLFDKDLEKMSKIQRSEVYNSEWIPGPGKGECYLHSHSHKKQLGTVKLIDSSSIKLPFLWTLLLPYENRECSTELKGRAKTFDQARGYVENIAYTCYPKVIAKKEKTIGGGRATTFAELGLLQFHDIMRDGELQYEFLGPNNMDLGEFTRIYSYNKTDSRGTTYVETLLRDEIDGIIDYYLRLQYDNGIMEVIAIYNYDLAQYLMDEHDRVMTRRPARANEILGTRLFDIREAPVVAVTNTTGVVANTANVVITDEAGTPDLNWLDDFVEP